MPVQILYRVAGIVIENGEQGIGSRSTGYTRYLPMKKKTAGMV